MNVEVLFLTELEYSGLSGLRLLVTRILLHMTATGFTLELLPLLTNSTLEAKLACQPLSRTTVANRDAASAHPSTTKVLVNASDTA